MQMKQLNTQLCGIPNGYQAFVLSSLVKKNTFHCHVTGTDIDLRALKEIISFIDPSIKVFSFPNWDTVPYDRVSVKSDIIGERIDTLTGLLNLKKEKVLVLTTAAAIVQRIPDPVFFENTTCTINEGSVFPFDKIQQFLLNNGYQCTNTVLESGEYAVRGGIIDLFPAGLKHPIRIDFFGDEIDSIKSFDEATQRTLHNLKSVTIKPISEFNLISESVSLFRTKYRALFDKQPDDYLYESVSNKIKVQGLEHFLPLFHEKLATLFDYLPNASISYDFQTQQCILAKLEQINEYFDARMEALKNPSLSLEQKYYPVPKELMFLSKDELNKIIEKRLFYTFSPFSEPDKTDMGGRSGQTFVEARIQNPMSVFETLASFVTAEKRKVIFAASTFGSAERLSGLLRDYGLYLRHADSWQEALEHSPALINVPFEKGFSTDSFIVITETDIFGERIIRKVSKPKNSNFITDINTLNIDDLVVHQTHGIGQFVGLCPVKTSGAVHDCLCLVYDGGDKLFVPVENADVLSKYGSQNVALDHLGSLAFAQKKEKVKKDLFVMAEKLIATASARALNKTERILAPHGLYQEFCARFPYIETDDQLRTIQEIENDLAGTKPMDRLVCGDVGFGKTEIALRAAFLTAMSGRQVALVVPTTLLALQHTKTFEERFTGFPLRIASLSRLISNTKSKLIHEELKDGTLDIIIGTHALLSKNICFKNLGLVIVDEEQHFGVTHKERLKELQKGVHVLTLTATPIPRTLQLSLSGVRELSIIATPPVDRLAVKTFVTPFDPVIIKEAILREYFRGGQTFFVCPRISDMPKVVQLLSKLVPEIKIVQAHGQMSSVQLEKIMSDFISKKYDILLATSIIESGLDMPSVNTVIIYRADMFGLSALYQMRGRVGRGKLRAYAYLTTSPYQTLTSTAQKRLSVMQSLDSLGAGFTLASHDLDIRGAGNLLGEEQSGHIKEVGISLYQKMLFEAIQVLKKNKEINVETDFSPQISVGLPVLIPSDYVSDLDLRMDLYNRIGHLETEQDIEEFQIEMIDRFGKYPIEVKNLFTIIKLKLLAKKAHIERLDVGNKGATIAFHRNVFPNPAGLVEYISSQMGTMKIRSDQKLIVMRPWQELEDRLIGITKIIQKIAQLAEN